MKRPAEENVAGLAFPAKRPASGAPDLSIGAGDLALKLLLEQAEAAVLEADNSSPLRLAASTSGARVALVKALYPGTQYRELTACGTRKAVQQALEEVLGQVGLGELPRHNVRAVVPVAVGPGLMNAGGALQRLYGTHGLSFNMESSRVPAGPVTELSEQAIILNGPAEGLVEALQILLMEVAIVAGEPWFASWASTSHAAAGSLAGLPVAGDGGGGPPGFAMKVLVSPEEASTFRNEAGQKLLGEIEAAMRVRIQLSADGMPYPGTVLQEYNVQGANMEDTVGACVQLLTGILETIGSLTCGDAALPPGHVRVRTVIPAKAAAALIGPGGQMVKQVRAASQMHVHVEMQAVPLGALGPVSEQCISLDGPGAGVQTAFSLIGEITASFATEGWFSAWATNSHCGVSMPGLWLFQEGKGKSKGKASKGGLKAKVAPNGGAIAYGGMALKLLLPPTEGSCIVGRGGATIREIGIATGTKMTLSNQNTFYPGSQLQELKILGSSQAVLDAAVQALGKVAEECGGMLSGGEPGVAPGEARVKVLVPYRAAAAIIGPAGSQVMSMRQQSGMHIHVEDLSTLGPPTDVSEQIVSVSGPCEGVSLALSLIFEQVAALSGEPWFETWASHNHTGAVMPGVSLYDGRGKGGPKGVGKGKAKVSPGPPVGSGTCGSGGFEDVSGAHDDASLPSVPATFVAVNEGPQGVPLEFPGQGAPSMSIFFKLLLASNEVNVLCGDDGTLRKIQNLTKTQGMVSESHFPGCSLHEVVIQGPTPEAVFMSLLTILTKIGEVYGNVSSGDNGVDQGCGRIKAVMPKPCASALIGPGGLKVKTLQEQTGIEICIDTTPIACMDNLTEQAIVLRGALCRMQPVLEAVVVEVANVAGETWYPSWANHSNCGMVIPGLVLFQESSRRE